MGSKHHLGVTMSQLTAAQVQDCAAKLAACLFQGVAPALQATVATASVNWADLRAAVSALDAAFDTTLATASTQVPTTDTIAQYLASQIPAPASGGTAQQKTILACLTLLKRAGLI
jgi:hypothetical protein